MERRLTPAAVFVGLARHTRKGVPMHRFSCFALSLCLGFAIPVLAQEGGTGVGDDSVHGPPGDNPFASTDSPYAGPLGQVDNRNPHDACDTCFTIPGIGKGYTIFESVPLSDDSEHLILRQIPNPAPLADDEERPTVDEGGESLWYIGTQAYSGPQDTDIAPGTTKRMIDLKRIRARNETAIQALPGVHGLGIVQGGFGVWMLPGYGHIVVPKTIEGVPVQVFVEDPPALQGHQDTWFRPIPIGAGFNAYEGGVSGSWIGGGTLGPHIVRYIQGCCQIWSLTAAHIVKHILDDPSPPAGDVRIYQPDRIGGTLAGYVAHMFELERCGTIHDNDCFYANAVTNYMTVTPDVAAIDLLPYNVQQSPWYNTPTGTDPVRRLTTDHDSYKNGPSGVIRTATPGQWVKMWGAYSGPIEGSVFAVDRPVVLTGGQLQFKYCCLTGMNGSPIQGDSGAIVTYKGTSNRHVVGMHVGGGAGIGWFIPADDIKTAMEAEGKGFHHYWGTRSGYREPANTTCDPPGC